MIAAVDVHYPSENWASAAAVVFADFTAAEPAAEYVHELPCPAGYISGAFFKRELPCIMALLSRMKEKPRGIIVDGYVMLGEKAGLGRHLFEALNRKAPIIGVAKSKFKNDAGVAVYRGESRRPLYVTTAGIDPRQASENIRTMHGPHRIPTLLKRVDHLSRGAKKLFPPQRIPRPNCGGAGCKHR